MVCLPYFSRYLDSKKKAVVILAHVCPQLRTNNLAGVLSRLGQVLSGLSGALSSAHGIALMPERIPQTLVWPSPSNLRLPLGYHIALAYMKAAPCHAWNSPRLDLGPLRCVITYRYIECSLLDLVGALNVSNGRSRLLLVPKVHQS